MIACLFPVNEHSQAQDVISMRQNNGRYILPLQESQPEHGSQESTVSEDDEDNDPTRYSKLQLIFHSKPKAGWRFMIKTNENCCDIILSKSNNKISRRHCCITFDQKRRLILRDFSINGTIVTYDGQGGEKRQTIVKKDVEGRETCHHFT